MTIRTTTFGVLALSLLAPLAANAAGGTIRFTGAIVEAADCQVSGASAAPGSRPRVVCGATASRTAAQALGLVKVTTTEIKVPTSDGAAPGPKRQVVMLEYL